MDEDRRTFLKQSARYVLLTGAATVAWDYILAGAPEQAPNYRTTDHWWGMTIDVDKCIGSGNCVRACKAENDVPLEDGCFRTWVERYRVDPDDPEHPLVDSPNGGYDGFPDDRQPRRSDARRSSSPRCATTAWTRRARRSARWARRSTARTASCSSTSPAASGAATACRRVRTAAGSSTRGRTPPTSARSATTASRKG